MYNVGDRVKVIRYPDGANSPLNKIGTVTETGISSMFYIRVEVDGCPGPNGAKGWLFLKSEVEPVRSSYVIGQAVDTPYGIGRITLLAAHPDRQQWSVMVKLSNGGSLYALRDDEVSPVNNVDLWV